MLCSCLLEKICLYLLEKLEQADLCHYLEITFTYSCLLSFKGVLKIHLYTCCKSLTWLWGISSKECICICRLPATLPQTPFKTCFNKRRSTKQHSCVYRNKRFFKLPLPKSWFNVVVVSLPLVTFYRMSVMGFGQLLSHYVQFYIFCINSFITVHGHTAQIICLWFHN